jgi:hypothetical protein
MMYSLNAKSPSTWSVVGLRVGGDGLGEADEQLECDLEDHKPNSYQSSYKNLVFHKVYLY